MMEERFFDALSERTSVAENLLKLVAEGYGAADSRRRSQDFVGESGVGRVMEIEYFRDSLEKELESLREKEREFDTFREGKKRKLELEEEELRLKREEFLNDAKIKEEELNEKMVTLHEHSEWLEMAQNEVQSIRRWAWEKWVENESQEQKLKSARESLAEKEKKVDLVIGRLDGRINEVEKREKEFELSVERKQNELVSKEKELYMKWEEFSKEVKKAEEKFAQQEKLRHLLMEKLELAETRLEGMRETTEGKLKEIEGRVNVDLESVAVSVNDADLVRESMEKKLEEFEKMKREFISFQEEKMRELVSKEQQMSVMNEELVRCSKLADEQLTQGEKSGHKLLKRLELAKHESEKLKELVHEKFKDIRLKQIELNSIRDWVEKKMEETDSKAKELEEKEKVISLKENNVISLENELQKKTKDLNLNEKKLISLENELQEKTKDLNLNGKKLDSQRKELEVKLRDHDLAQELYKKQLDEIEKKEKTLDSVKVFTSNCFKEHRNIKKQLQYERDLVAKRAEDLEHKEKQFEVRVREFELQERQMRDSVKELDCKKQLPSDALLAHVENEPDESVDLKFEVRMDGKTLQIFLNDSGRDMESMANEIFVVLHLSSDPAKLVLDAMEGFYPPHLRDEDVGFNVRRSCIILLQQLIKMSPKIKPSVREAALELANTWKSKMTGTTENLLKLVGFLHLLAAYDITSHFDKDEILGFLMMVAQQGRTPELCRFLGLTENIQLDFTLPESTNELKMAEGIMKAQGAVLSAQASTSTTPVLPAQDVAMAPVLPAQDVATTPILPAQESTSTTPKVGKGKKEKEKGKGKRKGKVLNPKGKVQKKQKVKSDKGKCFHCGAIGHWKRNCVEYLASLPTKPSE